MEPVFPESTDAACEIYIDKFSYAQRRRVRYITSVTVSPGQCAKFRGEFPLLERCVVGPLHLAIGVEQSTCEYKSELSTSLRRVLSKFNPVEHGDAAVGRFYNGETLGATSSEQNYRAGVIFQTNCAAKARRRLRTFNCEKGLKSRSEFCMYMEDFVVASPVLSSKRANASAPSGNISTPHAGRRR